MLSFILILFVCPFIVLSICAVLHFKNHFKIKSQCNSNSTKQAKPPLDPPQFKRAITDTINYDKHLNCNLELHIPQNNSTSNNMDMIPRHISHPSHLSETSAFSASYKESHKFKCKTLIQKCLHSLHIFHSKDTDWNFFPISFLFYILFLLSLTLMISLKYNTFTFSMVNNSCNFNHNYPTLKVSHSTFITDWITVYCVISLNLWQSLFTWYRYYSTRQCSLLRVGDTTILCIYYSFYLFFFLILCILQLHWIYALFPLIIITHFSYNVFCIIQFCRILWKQYNMFSGPDIKGLEIVNDNMLYSVKVMLCISIISCCIESLLLSLLISCYNIDVIVYLPFTYSISSFAFSFNFVRNRVFMQQIVIKLIATTDRKQQNNNNDNINKQKQKQKPKPRKPPSITPQMSSNDSFIYLQQNKISIHLKTNNKTESESSAKLNVITTDRKQVKTMNDRDDSNPSWIMIPTEIRRNNDEDTPNTASTLPTPTTPKSVATSNIITPISPFTPSDIPQEIKKQKKKKIKQLPLIKSYTDSETKTKKSNKKHKIGTKSEPSSPSIQHRLNEKNYSIKFAKHPNITAKFKESPILNGLNSLNPSNSLNPFHTKHYNMNNWAKALSLNVGLVAQSASDAVIADDDQFELEKISKSEPAGDCMVDEISFDDWYNKHNIDFKEGGFVYLDEEESDDDELENNKNKDENNNDENNDKQSKRWNTFKNTIQAIYPENTLKLQESTSEQKVEISSIWKRNSKLSSAVHKRSSSYISKQDMLKAVELEFNIENIEEEEEEEEEEESDDDDDDDQCQNRKNAEIIAMLRLMVQHGFYSKNTLHSLTV